MRKNRHQSRRNKKGGFFSKKTVVPSEECDVNNLSTLTKMPDVNGQNGELKSPDDRMEDLDDMTASLQTNYKKCCPKGFMGRKNKSPYCNQLDTTFKSINQHKNDISGYHGDETNVENIKETMNVPPKKPRYKFWGGKKSRNHGKKSRNHGKRSHKRRHTYKRR